MKPPDGNSRRARTFGEWFSGWLKERPEYAKMCEKEETTPIDQITDAALEDAPFHLTRYALRRVVRETVISQARVLGKKRISREGGSTYYGDPSQLSLFEIISLTRENRRRMIADRESWMGVLEAWCAAHPAEGLTAEDLWVQSDPEAETA